MLTLSATMSSLHFGDDHDSSGSSSDEDEDVLKFMASLRKLKENDPATTSFLANGWYGRSRKLTNEIWEQLGQDIANNDYLNELSLGGGVLDDQKTTYFFRGLTRSKSITYTNFGTSHFFMRRNIINGFGVDGLRSMVPFLRNANKLKKLVLSGNRITSEGFNVLFRALRDSPIEELWCANCGLDSIEIDSDNIPTNLTDLSLDQNKIAADGCREVAKLLQRGNSTLTDLHLDYSKIDDDGVEILANALKRNTSLRVMGLVGNRGMSLESAKHVLKLLYDVSSIEGTLQSNHTVVSITSSNLSDLPDFGWRILDALQINKMHQDDPKTGGKTKVINTQLRSVRRREMCRLQGEAEKSDASLYSEINPLHLPEVLAIVSRHHEPREFHLAVRSSIVALFSTANRKMCLQQERAHYAAKVREFTAKMEMVDAEIASLEETEMMEKSDFSCSNKRRRTKETQM